jgi:hypothetical protein
MAGLIDSIFGGSVADVTRARQEETSRQIQNQLKAASRYREPTVGEQFGTSFGTAFGGKIAEGVFGDPKKEAAQKEEEFLKQLGQEYELGSKEFLYGAGQYYLNQGELGKATQLVSAAEKMHSTDVKSAARKDTNEQIAQKLNLRGFPERAALVRSGGVTDDQTISFLRDSEKISEQSDPYGNKYSVRRNAQGNVTETLGLVAPAAIVIEKSDTPGELLILNKSTGELIKKVDSIGEAKRQQDRIVQVNNTISKIQPAMSILDEIEQMGVSEELAGIGYGMASSDFNPFPTDSKALASKVNTIKSMLTMETLLNLKKQGGTLGAINQAELEMLSNAVSELNPALSEQDFQDQVNKIRLHYKNSIDIALGKEPNIDYSRPEYKDFIQVDSQTGKEYFVDPTNSKRIIAIKQG